MGILFTFWSLLAVVYLDEQSTADGEGGGGGGGSQCIKNIVDQMR